MQVNLWDKIRNGDSSAMKSLYQTSYQELYVYGFKLIGDKEKTKDAIHELFCEFWDRRANLPVVLQLMPYLKICVRNKLLKQIKLDSVTLNLPDTFETKETIQQSYEALLISNQAHSEKRKQLQAGIEKLTKMQREVLQLRFYQGLSYEEISHLLDLKIRTVYNHIHSALNVLRENLA